MSAQSNQIQKRIIVSFTLIGAALVVGSFLILQFTINSTFRTLEAEQSAKDLVDVENAIERQIAGLTRFNLDYASWDSTYEVMANRALLADYIKDNLSLEQWPDSLLDIDGMLLFDTDGAYVAGKLFHHSLEEELSIEKVVLRELESRYPGFTAEIPEKHRDTEISGFINTSHGLLLVISGPILDSNYSGEPRGRFLTVQFLTPRRLEAIERRARVQLKLLPPSALETQDPEERSNYIMKYHPIKDILGATLAIIEVGTPKDISQVGMESIQKALLFLSLAIIVAIFLAWRALWYLMVKPLLSLKTHVKEMRETENLASRYSVREQDEVGTLAEEINSLALKLDTSQKDLTAARDEAESSSRVKSEFLSTMSHELRTPLNGVIGMTGILLQSKLSKQQQHYAQIVMSSGQALLKLINDILKFSQVKSGEKTSISTQFSLEELLQDVNAIVSEAARLKDINYQVVVNENVPDTLIADGRNLKQLLLGLLDNAVKFTHAGKVVLSVDCLEERETGNKHSLMLSCAIRDTGIGIRQEDLGTIFELFSQADNSSTREFGGAGLGLSLCKDLVEMMGGEITVSSVYGEGSEFLVTVPVKYPAHSI